MSTRLIKQSAYPASPLKPVNGHRISVKDRYSPEGARLVAGVIVLSNEISHPCEPLGKYVLCISSSRHPNKIVLPKGGWEDHETVEEAALRECWEEAGVVAQVTRFLIQAKDPRPPKAISRAEYRYFEVSPRCISDDWPERDKRTRMWLTYTEAARVLADRTEMLLALQASSIVKS
ncbi:hypothetical protein BCR37DRAFT_353077 [Protomyces lactucae-debilis]|uniref:Nudix hydrolase domain-containing protein n=1 Tax=Protomyces lactucae-debilis TaxID=2754530 RepID=A0A1Y2EPB0_PROLT|nr:uncharacterized protein BCR37DRAFT_353077 [Protomyces lactucae-debilis]ORY73382.1 hypothetical protein BCR37DRAFT_353077 [Protomyces lactucae-debilis]